MNDQYAVFGNPIAHSKSPAIHRAFADETGQVMTYEARLSPLDDFAGAVNEFVRQGGLGFNVTIPFKEEAFGLARAFTARAELAGAVNTMKVLESGLLEGDNTDGIGLIRDLTLNNDVELVGRAVLVLGAGGAARGVVGPLLETQPGRLFIANRTAEKAEVLAEKFGRLGPVEGGGFDKIGRKPFDVVINATSAGLSRRVPPIPLTAVRPRGTCYDMVYSDLATPFQKWARAAGAGAALDGLGMLVEQAAEAFYLWRGVRPDSSRLIKSMRNSS